MSLPTTGGTTEGLVPRRLGDSQKQGPGGPISDFQIAKIKFLECVKPSCGDCFAKREFAGVIVMHRGVQE